MFKKILALCLCYCIISTAFLVTGVSADNAEMRVFYDPCHSLDNVWSGTNIQVVDDDIGNANYNNGGKMIGLADTGAFEIVYKVPEGRSFKSFFTEISTQDISASGVKLAYSEDGTGFTDFTFTWTQGSRPQPTNDGSNAYWSWKYSITVTAPENTDVKFIKIYHNGEGINRTYKFYLRKVSMFTAGGTILEDVTDSLSGAEKLNYEISNLMPYALYCYNKGTTEAEEIATKTDIFSDADLLAVSDLTKDAYVIYKAADTAAFASIEVNEVIRDSGKSIKIFASTDGIDYVEITSNSSRKGYIGNDKTLGAYWNSHYVTTADFDAATGYKYIKLMHPANTLTNANHYKLASVSFTTLDISKGCVTGDVYEEEFDSEMYHVNDFKNASANGSSISVSKDGYIQYKTLSAREVKTIELKADNGDIVLEAMDINKNKIIWNTEITTETSGSNTIISSDVPDGAAYVKISGEAVLTGITIETDDAVGSEWTYIDGAPGLSAELAGEPIDKLKSGCTVSFSIPVKNAGSELQNAKAYICVFEGDRMDKIEEFDADVKAGGKTTVSGSIDVGTVTEKTSVTVFLWTDLDSMIALGTEQAFGNK